MVRELLLQEARGRNLTAVPERDEAGRSETEEDALIAALLDAEVMTPKADEETCRRYYLNNAHKFRSADLYEARHILIAADPADATARAQARDLAERLIAELQADPSRFAELAAAYSACPSKEQGGNLGQIGPGQTVPEFERALASMPVGQVAAEPVETRYGFHIVSVERRISGRDLPFEIVQSRIAAWLDEKVRRVAIRQYIAILAGRAEISGITLDGSATPLVQ